MKKPAHQWQMQDAGFNHISGFEHTTEEGA